MARTERTENDDWRQAAKVEAGLRREFLQRAERAEAALVQIREVCDDNAAASCNQAMALAFVRSIAAGVIPPTGDAP